MDFQATKEELAKMILESDDSKLIDKVRKLLFKEKKDFYDEFTEDQKLEIQYGIDQLDRGERVSWEDLKKRLP
ncbi:hypothetical protein OGH69_17015 [Flavobacterium sp. MFBS3-15]|uniref:hypothetical protein n=1 Tax=Flavobacterium sp. MFBS3-15 TaxID=2989816 RepID=UPI002235DA7D|nr:hypothetical protein [Flavobacterium sp. MFBS3-15]MCW4470675.1 hypothetical protein [Flavobacterium sp. MFBS3-15]